MDPRIEAIKKRVETVSKIIPVAGGKGGIGKSTVSASLALILARKGYRVGLLDLDFCGPSAHVILGIQEAAPKEDKGLIPPEVHGIRFMSIVYFAKDHPSPLRGLDISNALIELLTITRWGALDYLIIDMPPGMGDATLDLLRFVPKAKFLILTTPSPITQETVKKLVEMLRSFHAQILGVIENMQGISRKEVGRPSAFLGVPVWGQIAFDPELEMAVGFPKRLLATRFARDLEKIAKVHLLGDTSKTPREEAT